MKIVANKITPSATSYNYIIAFLSVMILSVFTAYGQRPSGQIPSDSGPQKIDRGTANTNNATPKNISTLSAYLNELNQKGKLSPADTDYVITSEHTSSLSGVQHIYYRQAINGIEVLGTEASIHIAQDGKLATAHDRNLVKDLTSSVKTNAGALTAPQAIQAIANQMNYGAIKGLQEITDTKNANGTSLFTNGGISGVDIPAKQMYYLVPNDGIRMVWEISIQETNSSDWWNFRVDATTGTIIDKYNFTVYCNVNDGHNHRAHDNSHDEENCADIDIHNFSISENTTKAASAALADGATYNVYALPIESPYFGTRTLVVDPADPIASPFGWHDTNGVTGADSTTTSGNNTICVDDINANNAGGTSPNGGANLVFDHPFDATQTQAGIPNIPLFQTTNRSLDASTTNTFYWTNIIHDITYQYGFDEASGNFQTNNYGNGGISGDPVRGDVQDGSDTCNANFGTPTDGNDPRMQMFICGNNDSSYDNLVIVHEYAHGISTRLTGGAGNSGSLNNQEQQGEGWSDYYGYMYTMSTSNFTANRAVGTFLINAGPNSNGIRSFPYSSSMAVNSQDYQDLIDLGNDGGVAPHAIGEIWASMLYDLTQDLIAEYGFDADLYNGTGGNNISLALVTEGLKLQPTSPGFVDSRNAILLADQILYGGDNQCIIWESFASRGLGFSADQGSSNSRADGTAAFDVPPITFTVSSNDFCLSNDPISLSGGVISGGIYSGPGVTDNGDGISFTFDPTAAGEGAHTIIYEALDCNGLLTNDTDIITVTEILPELGTCEDVTLTLDANGIATFDPFSSNSVTIVGGDNDSDTQGFSFITLEVPQDITLSFDWSYTTTDLAGFDSAGYIIGNTFFPITDDEITDQSGSETVTLNAGDVFGFAVETQDNTFGAATAVFSNFSPGFTGDFASFNWENEVLNSDGSSTFQGESASLLDSCGNLVVNLSQETFTCLDIGTTTPVTITVVDSLGNEDTCTANVTITGNAASTTTFTGGAWDNGDPTGTSMAVINDTYDSAAMGDINACSCEIEAGQTTTIRDGDFMNVADDSAITTNNGTIEVHKTTPLLGGRDFTLLSSPMTTETRDGVYEDANRVFEIIPSLFTPHPDVTTALNFVDVDFDYFAQASTLASGQGFMVFPQAPNASGSVTLDHIYTAGTLNSGAIAYPLVYNGPISGNNFNLVGNPYPSAIDTDMLISTNDAINEVYYWEHLTQPSADNPGDNTVNHSMDDISIYNLTGGIAAVNGGTAPGRYMASGQGFGILADQNAAGATLDFTNAMRVTGNNGTVRSSNVPANKLWLQITDENDSSRNTTLIGFLNEATSSFDKGYDSGRLDTQISFYSTLDDGEELSIQARETFDLDMQVPLGFATKNEELEQYTISIQNIEGSELENAPVFLKDHLTDIVTNLKEQSYNFSAADTKQSDRFTVFFTPEDVLSTDTPDGLSAQLQLYPNPSEGMITLSYAGTEAFTRAIILDLNGKHVKELDLSSFNESLDIDLSAFSTGVYFIQIHTALTIATKKIIRK